METFHINDLSPATAYIDAITRECSMRYAALVERVLKEIVGDADQQQFIRDHNCHFRDHIEHPRVRELWIDGRCFGCFCIQFKDGNVLITYRGMVCLGSGAVTFIHG